MALAHSQEINWHWDALPRATKKALDFLSHQAWLKSAKWYLAGGTALALQYGYRRSIDLDFFTSQTDFLTGKLINHFKNTSWITDIVREGTVYGQLMEAKVSFIANPSFIPAEPMHRYGAVCILDATDVAVMKILAISQRGRKRDFVDLFWYVKHREPLIDIIARLKHQYPAGAHDYHQIAKSLTYFADAESDPMPQLRFRVMWHQIKKFFLKEMKRITPELLRLE